VSAQQHVSRMSLREKCAQMVFYEHRFGEDDPERTAELVKKEGVGGMLLVGGSKFDLPGFVNWAQKVAKFPVLVIGDYEDGVGGRVAGATVYPSAAAVAGTGSADFAQTMARHAGLEARVLGVRMTLGPAASNALARSAVDGFHYSKMAVCVRGFPGPGVAELAPEADAMLVGGAVAPDLDEEQPVCLSRAAILGTLRRELRFDGLVFTDALPRLGEGPELAERAVNAGVDAILCSAEPLKTLDALEAGAREKRIAEGTIDRAVTRLLLRKERLGLFAERVIDVAQVEKIVGSAAHRAAAERMAEAVKRL